MRSRNIRNRELVTEQGIEAVRRALRAGKATEKSITKATGLHWIEVQAALRLLEYHKEVSTNKKPQKYRGIVPSTFGYRKRKQLGLVTPRSTRGIRRKPYSITEIRSFFGHY